MATTIKAKITVGDKHEGKTPYDVLLELLSTTWWVGPTKLNGKKIGSSGYYDIKLKEGDILEIDPGDHF